MQSSIFIFWLFINIDNYWDSCSFLNSNVFTFKYLKTENTLSKIAFIAPKSVCRGAIGRNTLRRKGYRALRGLFPLPKGILGAFIFKKNETDFDKIQHEIKELLNKIN